MSKNRENVTWQNKDGTWGRGFFDFQVTGPDDEWDVEYDNSAFHWAVIGMPSEDAAHDAWRGANPGGGRIVRYSAKNRPEIERYERMAIAALARKPKVRR